MIGTKQYFLLVIALFLVEGVLAQSEIIDSSYANGYYKQRLAYFNQMPNRKKEIVFLGNSITEVGEWQEVVHLKNVINRGISGDNSFGVFYRLDEILASKPSKIFLMIGVNDIKRGTPLNLIIQNYERIAQKIQRQSPRTKLYFQSVLPVAESMLVSIYSKISNEKIREANKQLKRIAEKYQVPYIDLHNDVFANQGGQLQTDLTTDGLHLQPSAYILWVDYLKKHNYL
ncbi:MAG: GDSL-type esterase/lipase family protein [Sphingobacteriaceae bacterium]